MLLKRTALCVGRLSSGGISRAEQEAQRLAKARQQPAVASFCSTASNDVNTITLDVTRGNPAPCIKEELITEVQHCGAFVILFDKILNQTTESQQLDLHVLYWLNDQVQSGFYGAQFMGHDTAQDLLQHFKVSLP